MFNKLIFIVYLCSGIVDISSSESTSNLNSQTNAKDKRQIGYQQTNIEPQQRLPSNRVDTIYGTHPNQFVIRAIGQPIHDLQQRQSHNIVQQPEQAPDVSQQYAIIQELQPIREEKPVKLSRKYQIGKSSNLHLSERLQQQQPQQFIQYQQPVPQQYQYITPQDELIKYFQEEIAARALSPAQNSKKNQQHQSSKIIIQQENAPKQGGLNQYREISIRPENQEIITYIPTEKYHPQSHQLPPLPSPQPPTPPQYYTHIPIDYHKSIPNHPLAASSLEKELEKLVASNKPFISQLHQSPYKAPKLQQYQQQHQQQPQQQQHQQQQAAAIIYSTVPPTEFSPGAQEKIFSFLPDFAQLSGFQPTGEIYLDNQLQEQPSKDQSVIEREQKPRKTSYSNNGQYLVEKQQQKIKSNQQTYGQQKQSSIPTANHVPARHNDRNSAMKIIEAPSLQPKTTSTPIISYYKAESTEKSENQPQQQKLIAPSPSTSTIYVSQGTGLINQNPTAQSPSSNQPTKTYNEEKQIKFQPTQQLPPIDGSRPLTQEEFQILVDAGYPVQAVPVPIPVPVPEAYLRQHQQHQQQQQSILLSQQIAEEQQSRGQRRQLRPSQHRQQSQPQHITYLQPIRFQQLQQQQHEIERNYAQRSSS